MQNLQVYYKSRNTGTRNAEHLRNNRNMREHRQNDKTTTEYRRNGGTTPEYRGTTEHYNIEHWRNNETLNEKIKTRRRTK